MMPWIARLAQLEDISALENLIQLSARALQRPFYSQAQIEAALGRLLGTSPEASDEFLTHVHSCWIDVRMDW